jgi:transposase-like protein
MAKKKGITMTPGKREIISLLQQEYGFSSVLGIQDALKDLLGGTIQGMLEAELEHDLGHPKNGHSTTGNYRNGTTPKTLKSSVGEIPISVPHDREGRYEPQIVPKYSKDISEIERKIIAMYGRGLSTRQISEQIQDIYGFSVDETLVSSITNKILPQIREWQTRPLQEKYAFLFVDATVFSVRREGSVQKSAVYIVMGRDLAGMKDVLGFYVGENESAKYWMSVFNDLKSRGVKDALVVCGDGLTGLNDSVRAAFPQAEFQRCIVHMVRNTLTYVSYKDRKEYARDLKSIYHAPTEAAAHENMLAVREKWNKKYPRSMDRWEREWENICPMFRFSPELRKLIYTTNAMESLNSSLKRLSRNRSVFPSKEALEKSVYLAMMSVIEKWKMPCRDWYLVRNELSLLFPGRIDAE